MWMPPSLGRALFDRVWRRDERVKQVGEDVRAWKWGVQRAGERTGRQRAEQAMVAAWLSPHPLRPANGSRVHHRLRADLLQVRETFYKQRTILRVMQTNGTIEKFAIKINGAPGRLESTVRQERCFENRKSKEQSRPVQWKEKGRPKWMQSKQGILANPRCDTSQRPYSLKASGLRPKVF